MSSFKTLVIMAALAAAGYWMYMNAGQKSETSPADVQAVISPPTVQIPGLNSPPLQPANAPSSVTTIAPPTLLGGGSAPAYSANPSPITGSTGSAAGNPGTAISNTPEASGVTLISPPIAGNIPNAQPGSAVTGTTPSLLSGTSTGQAPAASYPAPCNTCASPAASLADGNLQNRSDALMESVQKQLDQGQLPEALLTLSVLYSNPDLSPAQARQVTDLLDQLAGTVIYSRQHLLEQPYIVRPGDTLDQIAGQYNVPAILLARINGIRDPQYLEPGRELKVLRGPFNAVVRLEKHELILMVGGRYAGRFAIGIGCDQPKLEGEYVVREKNLNPAYSGPGGVSVPGGDPRNPLGRFWIGLSDKVGLHGTVDPQNIGRDDNRGAICLGERDIDDLYGILSVGSRVVIQR